MDLVPHIYHETQGPGSMLCAQHALNNLLQQHLFTPQDLADIARRLDQLEADQLDEDEQGGESNNYDDSGFFSIMGSSISHRWRRGCDRELTRRRAQSWRKP